MKLKIYSEKRLPQKAKYAEIFYPFWGRNNEHPDCLQTGIFDRYLQTGKSYFELSSLEDADIIVLPFIWHDNLKINDITIKFIEKVDKNRDKPLVVFVNKDIYQNVNFKNSVVFQKTLYKSKQKANEYAIPGMSHDFIKKYSGGQFQLRRFNPKPSVGFCGYAPPFKMPSGKKKLNAMFRWGASQIGLTKLMPSLGGFSARARALHILSKSSLVKTNFIIREKFAFNNKGMLQPGRSPDLAVKYRQEYLENMFQSDYILCARGAANYSIRFYEALSCGRIPILVNTDCVLPYDFAIDWKKFCIWIDESELPYIAEKVAQFHANLSPLDFENLQFKCREIWEQWVSPQSFYANFYRHFKCLKQDENKFLAQPK